MTTTTKIPTEMLVLMNHIYELNKGVRHMVLYTCNKKYSELAIQRLESQGIPYLLQPAGQQNLNVYFGRRECLEAIRLFGCGDCSSYSDTFVGGMGELYNGIKNSGAKFIGSVETDGYTFDDSEAVIDGKFIGLPLDDINEDDKTDTRIEAWIAAITPEL